MNDQDVVITGAGAVTAHGVGVAAHWRLLEEGTLKTSAADYSLGDFKPAPHLSDRRMLKAVSAPDAIGLAALEGLVKDLGYKPGAYAAERVGLYVGAPPASAFDNEAYVDALLDAKDGAGQLSIQEFGRTCMSSRPTTLLVGLPNNVLCYGAMILDARGPNSNYTSSALSGHLALVNAARRVRRGQLDLAVAGGFAAHTEPVNGGCYAQHGLVRPDGAEGDPYATQPYPLEHGSASDGTVIADGGVFVSLERRGAALARGARVLATYASGVVTSDALGPTTLDERGEALEAALARALAEAKVGPDAIGLVLAGATGLARLDRCEFSVLSRVFAKGRELPALGNSGRALGNLLEAGGLLELGLLPALTAAGELPPVLRAAPPGSGFGHRLTDAKPYVMILRASPWGEYGCVIVRRELP